jgi:hypothetical protein
MKLRDSQIYLNDDLEEFMANIQPPITEENCSEILRCSECYSSESMETDNNNQLKREDEEEHDIGNFELVSGYNGYK